MGVKGEVERTSARDLEPEDLIGAAGRRKGADGGDIMMAGVDTAEGGEDGEGRGEDSWVEVSIDVPGQRDEDGTMGFLAEMIREGLVADGMLRGRLWINGGWHWRIYVDVCSPCCALSSSLLVCLVTLSLLSFVHGHASPVTKPTISLSALLLPSLLRTLLTLQLRFSSSPLLPPTPSPSSPCQHTSLCSSPVSLP